MQQCEGKKNIESKIPEPFLSICERSTPSCPKSLPATGEELFLLFPALWPCSILLQRLAADPGRRDQGSPLGFFLWHHLFRILSFPQTANHGRSSGMPSRVWRGRNSLRRRRKCFHPHSLTPHTHQTSPGSKLGRLQDTGRVFHSGQRNPPSSAKAGLKQREAFPLLRKGPRLRDEPLPGMCF